MLIALPNPDGSFTCTLFMDYAGEPSFESLDRPEVEAFLHSNFRMRWIYLEAAGGHIHGKNPGAAIPGPGIPLVIQQPGWLDRRCCARHRAVLRAGHELWLRRLRELECADRWNTIMTGQAFSRPTRRPEAQRRRDRRIVKAQLRGDERLSGDHSFQLRKKIEAKFTCPYPEPVDTAVFDGHVFARYTLCEGPVRWVTSNAKSWRNDGDAGHREDWQRRRGHERNVGTCRQQFGSAA